jgi:hypothetical protein
MRSSACLYLREALLSSPSITLAISLWRRQEPQMQCWGARFGLKRLFCRQGITLC